jgi:hypothetical protein
MGGANYRYVVVRENGYIDIVEQLTKTFEVLKPSLIHNS